jgi:hypothetical protein
MWFWADVCCKSIGTKKKILNFFDYTKIIMNILIIIFPPLFQIKACGAMVLISSYGCCASLNPGNPIDLLPLCNFFFY